MSTGQTASSGLARHSTLIACLLLGGMVISWSSGFIGYRFAAEHSGVMLASFWRFLLAALMLLPWGLGAVRALGWRGVLVQACVGAFAIAGYLAPIAKAIEWGLAPGLTALIANLLPVALVCFSALVPGQRASLYQLAGLGVCLAGMLLSGLADLQAQRSALWLCVLPVFGVLSLAISSVFQRRQGNVAVPALGGLFIQICATLPVFAALAWQEGALVPESTHGFILGIGWLAVVSTFGGYGLYWVCLRRFSMQTVSAALFLTPMVTMLWSSVQFGEPLSRWGVIGSLVTVLGVWGFATSRRKKPLPPTRETASSPDLSA